MLKKEALLEAKPYIFTYNYLYHSQNYENN